MFEVSKENKTEVEQFIADILTGLDMRTQERIFNKAKVIHKIVREESARDCSIMIFEILYLTVAMKMKDKNLYWLSKIWTSKYVDAEHILGREYYELLSGYGKRVCSASIINGIRIINDTIVGRTFFWLATLYKGTNEQCDYIAYPDADNATIQLIERFSDLIDVIDVD